jgi:hypothetical protein
MKILQKKNFNKVLFLIGKKAIYDGTFTNKLIKGQGITSNILF